MTWEPFEPYEPCTCGHPWSSHGYSTADTNTSCFKCGCWGFEKA